MKEKYQIRFQKIITQKGYSKSRADTDLDTSVSIAFHINLSSHIEAKDQIDSINSAISRYNQSLPFDDFWGEVAGSSLWIYPENNTVTVGYSSTVVPITDFLQLLQEWLTFIDDENQPAVGL